MDIRFAVSGETERIAQIHKEEIRGGFLSSLNASFLTKVYESIVRSSVGFCVVAKEDGRVVGFIGGTTDVNKTYRYFLFHHFLSAILLLIGQAMNVRTGRKIAEVLLYPRKERKLPKAELLTIAVAKDFQGKGVAGQMFHMFVQEMRKRGVKTFKVLVGEELAPAIRFYEKNGFHFHSAIAVHGKEQSRIYVYDVE